MEETPHRNAPDDAVTASDLARHFGHWQRRALQTPVYILHHGRPQFVLASIEFMQALSAARPPDPGGNIPALLDALTDPVLICDPAGVVMAAGRAARLYFGKAAQPGATFDAILAPEVAAYLRTIIVRVAASGIAERADLPAGDSHARLQLTVEPSTFGVILAGRDAGVADTRDAALAHAASLAAAVSCLAGHAVMTIGLRGDLLMPSAALARLTGRTVRALAGAPAATLFTRQCQPIWHDTLEKAFAGAPAFAITADLLLTDDATRPISVALAPLRRGLVVEGVQAIIAPNP